MELKEQFIELWEEASNTVKYRLISMKSEKKILWKNDVNSIIHEEIVHKRFFSKELRHSSHIWFDTLREAHPECASQIRNIIMNYRSEAGVAKKDCAIQLGTGVAAGTIACTILKKYTGWNLIAATITVGTSVYAIANVYSLSNKAMDTVSDELDVIADRISELLSNL